MRRTARITWSAAGMVGVLATTGALAQQSPKPSFKSLLLDGYEVKNVVFIPIDALKRMKTGDSKVPQVIVTLQRGTATAACQYSANNWSNQAPSSLEGTTQCDVYEAK